jgi:hypothetical protein
MPSVVSTISTSDNYVLYSNCSSLTGWVGNATVDTGNAYEGGSSFRANPTPAIQMASLNVGITTFVDTTILLRMRVINSTGGLANFFFGCNAAGGGTFVRLDTRSATPSGFANSQSWGSWNAPAAGPVVATNTWYNVAVSINTASVASFYLNGNFQGSAVANIRGPYVAVHSDGGTTGANYDNIRILQGGNNHAITSTTF